MLKMFIAVRRDLTPQQRAVQACHAVAEYLLSNDVGKSLVLEWRLHSNTMVLVGVDDERELQLLNAKLTGTGRKAAVFHELDMNSAATALAVIADDKCTLFRDLELL